MKLLLYKYNITYLQKSYQLLAKYGKKVTADFSLYKVFF